MESRRRDCAVLGSFLKLALLIAVAVTACSPPASVATTPTPPPVARDSAPPTPDDSFFGIDKVKHFFIAGFVESMAFAGAQAAGSERSTARPVAIGAVGTVSVGRELYDWRAKGHFSVRDLVWDALGAGAALLVLNKTQR